MHSLHKFTYIALLASLIACTHPETGATKVNKVDIAAAKSEVVQAGTATYLGNEAVMIEHRGKKILFDPFFHNAFDTYQLVPDSIRKALFSGIAPYDSIDAIFISHAHGDHFSAEDLIKFLNAHAKTQVYAPQQAIEMMNPASLSESVLKRLHPIALKYRDAPQALEQDGIKIDAVRIPHAGWPQRSEVSNLVFRVSLSNEVTVVHMGDADPDDAHFKPLLAHWEQQQTDTAFPPYWFFMSEEGKYILSNRIQASENIGVHVPVNVPTELMQTGELYFSEPGESRQIR